MNTSRFGTLMPVPRAVSIYAFVLAVCLSDLAVGDAPAQDFYIDFGVADANPPISSNLNEVFPGYSDYSLLEESVNNLGDKAGTVEATTQVVNGVSFTLNSLAGEGTAWRDRPGDVTHAQGDLLEDHVAANTSTGGLVLTISGLPQSSYSMTTYHHDAQWANVIESVSVDVGSGETTVASNFPASTGWSPTSISTVTFSVVVSGTEDVTVRFIPQTFSVTLNGLDLIDTGTTATEETSWTEVKEWFR